MDQSADVQPGQIVKVLRGRESHQYAIVVGVMDDRFVWIADGDKRKFDQPKKKNRSHLEPQSQIAREVADSLAQTGRVTNGKLRYALGKFAEQQRSEAHDEEKGE